MLCAYCCVQAVCVYCILETIEFVCGEGCVTQILHIATGSALVFDSCYSCSMVLRNNWLGLIAESRRHLESLLVPHGIYVPHNAAGGCDSAFT